MGISSLLNTPRSDGEWQRWSFNHAQDHLKIIQAIQAQTGNVTSVALTNGGSGYTSIPGIQLDPNGKGATFNIQIKGGVMTSLTVAAGGTGYRSPYIQIVGGGGSGATASLTLNPWTALQVYQLDPINFQNPTTFVKWHAQTHTDMNGALGLQSIDLSGVDIKDANKLQAWAYSNYQEHNNVHEKLNI